MNRSDIQLLFDYNYWANQQILTKTAELSLQQFTQATSFPWGNLHRTLIHILDTEYAWRNLCQHNQITPLLTETEAFPTFDSIVSYWKNEESEMHTYLNGLQEDDMENTIQYHIDDNLRERVLWHCLVHVVNHGTQHRSECAVILTDLDQSPGDIDFTVFLSEQG